MNELVVMFFLPITGLLIAAAQSIATGFLLGVGAILAARVFKVLPFVGGRKTRR
jgi:hypothetical protein